MSFHKTTSLVPGIAGGLCSLLFFTACVPLPHSYTKTPRVSGTVTKDGAPLTGAKIIISQELHDDACGVPTKTATTDSNGKFKLSKTRGFDFFVTMGDHIYSNQVCIEAGDKKFIGYSIGGIGFPPSALRLKCDINSKSRPVDSNTSEITMEKIAVCTLE